MSLKEETMVAVVVNEHGGPEVLQVVERRIPTPQPGEVLIHHAAIGVNFVDTQHRAGTPYPVAVPFIPGIEAAGEVIATGADVRDYKPGDRVAFAGHMTGVYAQYSCVPEEWVIPIPDNVSYVQAAAVLLQGMTAHALTQSAYHVKPNDIALIHAASGGVGLHLVQMAKRSGATVIGTVSSLDKAQAAQNAGADHVLLSSAKDIEAQIKRITQGEGVHVVYDAIGHDTFDISLNALRAMGYLVIYGLSSGSVPPFDINRLSGITGASSKGSLFLTWATLSDYATRREDLLWRSRDVLNWVGEGSLKLHIAGELPLTEARQAHEMLASRRVVGKLVLIP